MNRQTKKMLVLLPLAVVAIAGIVWGSINLVSWIEKKKIQNSMKKYEYGAGPVAPVYYPVQVNPGFLLYENNTEYHGAILFDGGMLTGAGLYYGGLSYVRRLMGVPVGIDATWLSRAEKKFYKISVRFDIDSMRRMFEKGYNDVIKKRLKDIEGKEVDSIVAERQDFNQVDIGFIPGGRVIVYFCNGATRLIAGIYQGEETKVDLNKLWGRPEGTYQDSNFQRDLVDMIDKQDSTPPMNLKLLSHYKKYGIPYSLWDKYFERFNYVRKVVFEKTDTMYKTTVYINCFNAEMGGDQFNLINPAARPKMVGLTWKYDTTGYSAYCFFEEAEVMHIFEEAYGNDRNQKGEMLFKVGKYNNKLDISLKVGDKEYPFKKVKMDIYQEKLGDSETVHRIYSNKWDYGFLTNPYSESYIGL